MLRAIQIRAMLLLIVPLCICGCAAAETAAEPEEYDFVEVKAIEDLNSELASGTGCYYSLKELYAALGLDEDPRYSAWPDDVGSIFCYNGFVVVTLTDFTQEKIDEYRGMVSEPDCLRFAKARFSQKEVGRVMEEIALEEEQYPEYGIEKLLRKMDFEDPHVICYVPTGSYRAAKRYFSKKYGDIVEVIEVKDEDFFREYTSD